MFKKRARDTFDEDAVQKDSIRNSKLKPTFSAKTNDSFPSDNNGEPSKLQVLVSSSSSSDPQTAVIDTSEERFLKERLSCCVWEDEWHEAESIYEKFPDMVRFPLNGRGDTALHIAVMQGRTKFVEGLLNSKHMAPQYFEITNSIGNNAFCVAAMFGNVDFISKMVEKNDNLPLIRGYQNMFPVHLAALNGHQEIVEKLLSSEDLLQKMGDTPKDIERLFSMTIRSRMCHVARKLFSKYPSMLAIARDEDEQLTALHMLAQTSGQATEYLLVKEVWDEVRQLEHKRTLELITQPSEVLFDAVISGNFKVIWVILETNPELVTRKDSQGRSLLHIAALYQRGYFFNDMFTVTSNGRKLIQWAVDKDGNNVLHFAAQQPEVASLRSNTKMHSKLEWFKEVEEKVPHELRTMRNLKGETPLDTLHANHKEDQKTANGIATSGMLVAALIATVVFAAALTFSGDKYNVWFVVFSLTNALALFSSAASIIFFLSIFTSTWFEERETFISQLPRLIKYGLLLLFISIVTMVIAFAAAFFLIFQNISKWVAYVVVLLGFVPIIMFLKLQSSLFDKKHHPKALLLFYSLLHRMMVSSLNSLLRCMRLKKRRKE